MLGLWVLIVPEGWGKHLLQALSRPCAALFLLWHLSSYIATAVGPTMVRGPIATIF